MDSEIVDLVDESKIEEDVSDSCNFAGAIQACTVDTEDAAIHAKTNDGKSQEGQGTTLDSQSSSNSSFQMGTQSHGSTNIPTHAKLPNSSGRNFPTIQSVGTPSGNRLSRPSTKTPT